MIHINTTKLSHRFHTVKPIHFVFFPSKFTRLNQCVRWQFRNHEVFLIYTRFLRGKIVFSTNNIFCVSKQYCFEKLLCFREKTQNSDFFKSCLGVMYRSNIDLKRFSIFSCFRKTHLRILSNTKKTVKKKRFK